MGTVLRGLVNNVAGAQASGLADQPAEHRVPKTSAVRTFDEFQLTAALRLDPNAFLHFSCSEPVARLVGLWQIHKWALRGGEWLQLFKDLLAKIGREASCHALEVIERVSPIFADNNG